ncbi:MAG: nuclear transport factor 2 family protein [Actinomycetota bacterium]
MSADPETTNGRLVERYFAAMRVGAAAEDDMLSLFTDDAEYVEPFSGSPEPALGRAAIRDRLRSGWAAPPPDMELDVESVVVDGDRATSTWECRSPAFPRPVRGLDEYEFRDGRISRLVVRITPD